MMRGDMQQQIDGLYPWPFDGVWSAADTALLVIDMQRDMVDPAGWLAASGRDWRPLTAVVPAVARLLAGARAAGAAVMYTRETHRADLREPLVHDDPVTPVSRTF